MILLVGPDTRYVTGQSLAFRYVVDGCSYKDTKYRVLYNSTRGAGAKRVADFFRYLFTCLYIFMFIRPSSVYVTVSRSRLGCVRDILLFLFSRLCKSRIIIHLHGSDLSSFVHGLSAVEMRVVMKAYSWVSDAVVLTERMTEQVDFMPFVKVHVVENCFDFDAEDIPENEIKSPLRLLFLSNIMVAKGVFELLEASRQLLGQGVEIHLKLAGSFLSGGGKSAEEVERLVEGFLCDSIEYVGHVDDNGKLDLLAWCDVVILPSYNEAQPLVLIEGMAAGRFVIASNVGYIEDIVTDRVNGFILDDVSPAAVVSALKRAAEDRRFVQLVSTENRGYAATLFAKQIYLEKLLKILGV